jgi:shikimate kinase
MAPSVHVVLIGLRGAGKTTVGQSLAARVGRPFHDLDELVLRRLGVATAIEVFETQGEPAWRAGEYDALQAFLNAPLTPSIVALGSGAPAEPAIHALLSSARLAGRLYVIHLECRPALAAERLSANPGDRTSITGRGLIDELGELYAARTPAYRALADRTIDAGSGDPAAIAALCAG